MLKYLLLITLIILILIFPTYCLVHIPEEDKIRGCKVPFIMALLFRLRHPQDIIFISYNTFKTFWENVEKSK